MHFMYPIVLVNGMSCVLTSLDSVERHDQQKCQQELQAENVDRLEPCTPSASLRTCVSCGCSCAAAAAAAAGAACPLLPASPAPALPLACLAPFSFFPSPFPSLSGLLLLLLLLSAGFWAPPWAAAAAAAAEPGRCCAGGSSSTGFSLPAEDVPAVPAVPAGLAADTALTASPAWPRTPVETVWLPWATDPVVDLPLPRPTLLCRLGYCSCMGGVLALLWGPKPEPRKCTRAAASSLCTSASASASRCSNSADTSTLTPDTSCDTWLLLPLPAEASLVGSEGSTAPPAAPAKPSLRVGLAPAACWG